MFRLPFGSLAFARAILSLPIAVAIAVVLLASPAHAAIMPGEIFAGFLPYFEAIAFVLIIVLVGAVLELLRRKFGLDIEARHREALQTALTNAAGLLLNRIGNSLHGKSIDIGNPAIAEAVNYVGKAAPDALRKFGITPESLKEKILAKLPQVANTTTPANG